MFYFGSSNRQVCTLRPRMAMVSGPLIGAEKVAVAAVGNLTVVIIYGDSRNSTTRKGDGWVFCRCGSP